MKRIISKEARLHALIEAQRQVAQMKGDWEKFEPDIKRLENEIEEEKKFLV